MYCIKVYLHKESSFRVRYTKRSTNILICHGKSRLRSLRKVSWTTITSTDFGCKYTDNLPDYCGFIPVCFSRRSRATRPTRRVNLCHTNTTTRLSVCIPLIIQHQSFTLKVALLGGILQPHLIFSYRGSRRISQWVQPHVGPWH